MRIGVDLGGTKIEIAVLSNSGEVVFRRRLPTPPGYQDKLDAVHALVNSAETELGIASTPVGLGHPGSLNPRTGLMRNANTTALNGQPLKHDIETVMGRPVACANDANCFALSEAFDGAGQHAHSVFGVIIGTGVGGALVIDKALHSGHDGNAGEWGHTALPWPEPDEIPGPQSKCGLYGCVEAWCSGPALSADHKRQSGQSLTAHQISELAEDGEPHAITTLDRHSTRLAKSLATVINIFDPQCIVLGGGLSNLPNLTQTLANKLPAFVFSDDFTTEIVTNMHGDSSGVRGAAWLNPVPSPC